MYDHYFDETTRHIEKLIEACNKQTNDREYLKLVYNLKYFIKENDDDKKKLSSIRSSLVQSLVNILNEIKANMAKLSDKYYLNEAQNDEVNLNDEINQMTINLNEFNDAKLYLNEFIEEDKSLSGLLDKSISIMKSKFKALLDNLKDKVIEFNRKLDFAKSVNIINIIKKF